MWGLRKRTADFVIQPHDEPIMSRWYIIPRNKWFNIYLHRLDGTNPQHAHDHPWWNLSFLLKGKRKEYMPYDPLPSWEVGQWAHPASENYSAYLRASKAAAYQVLKCVVRKPGSVVFRRATEAHRLETVGAPSYSLFITGPVVRVWGFWKPEGWTQFKDYVEVVDGVSRQKA